MESQSPFLRSNPSWTGYKDLINFDWVWSDHIFNGLMILFHCSKIDRQNL